MTILFLYHLFSFNSGIALWVKIKYIPSGKNLA